MLLPSFFYIHAIVVSSTRAAPWEGSQWMCVLCCTLASVKFRVGLHYPLRFCITQSPVMQQLDLSIRYTFLLSCQDKFSETAQ